MTRLQRLGEVRMHLAQAVTRGCDDAFDAASHVAAAERLLVELDEHELATMATKAIDVGPDCAEGRYQIRELMQLLDAQAESRIEAFVESQFESEANEEEA